MSRPLKLKVTGTVLGSVFQLPDHGFLGQFAGAHRKRFLPNPVEEIASMYSRSSSVPTASDPFCLQKSFTVRLLCCRFPQPSLCASKQVGSLTLASGFAHMQAERYSAVQTHIASIASARKGS
jgi:hypothetical protein